MAADLSNSKITNKMVNNMLKGWKNCHSITLANNSIGDEAARKLCQAFYAMRQPALSQLSLAYNCLTDACASDLATLIATCSTMDALDVEGTKMDFHRHLPPFRMILNLRIRTYILFK